MKYRIQRFLHFVLGFENYLFLTSVIKILIFKKRPGEEYKAFLKFMSLIPHDSTVLDVGANIGVMTTLLSRDHPDWQIYSFEPMPRNYKTVQRIAHIFKLRNAQIYQMALGNEDGQVEMLMPVQKSVKQSAWSHVAGQGDAEEEEIGERVHVPCKRLDSLDFLFHTDKPINGIKIDVEDFEYFVFQGAQNLLATYHPIVYAELAHEDNRNNCFEFFKTLNYKAKVYENGELVDYDNRVHHWNFFFMPA